MNPKSNRVNNSNCFNNKKEEVKQIIYRKALLLASIHLRDYIFLRDSLLELAAQITFVTLCMQISSRGNDLIVFNIDFSGRFKAHVLKYDVNLRCLVTLSRHQRETTTKKLK